MLSENLRKDFAIYDKYPKLIYLNSAATSLKPRQVVQAIDHYYNDVSANTGRGSHALSREATEEVEQTRHDTAKFLNAKNEEVVFTKNTTESINTAAVCLERAGKIRKGSEIVLSLAEHHANILPWQEICKRTGAKLSVVNLNKDFTLDIEDLRNKITKNTAVVAMAQVTNTTGAIYPLAEIGKIAHENGALFLVDGAQGVPHTKTDVKKIGADFLAFSAHKMLGPTGVGVLFGKEDLLNSLPPYNVGGGIIKSVSMEKTEYISGAEKFEPGTHQIGEIYGFRAALKYLQKVGMENIEKHDRELIKFTIKEMQQIKGMKIYSPVGKMHCGPILFEIEGIDSVDLGVALEESCNVAIRTGFMCAEPIIRSLNAKGVARASFYLYNTRAQAQIFTRELAKIAHSFE